MNPESKVKSAGKMVIVPHAEKEFSTEYPAAPFQTPEPGQNNGQKTQHFAQDKLIDINSTDYPDLPGISEKGIEFYTASDGNSNDTSFFLTDGKAYSRSDFKHETSVLSSAAAKDLSSGQTPLIEDGKMPFTAVTATAGEIETLYQPELLKNDRSSFPDQTSANRFDIVDADTAINDQTSFPDQTSSAGTAEWNWNRTTAENQIAKPYTMDLQTQSENLTSEWQDELLTILPGIHDMLDRGNFVTGNSWKDQPDLQEIQASLTEAADELLRIGSIIDKIEQEYRT